ncbi:MAG: bifunctional diaminohydroxyphosphoribosylaminopyrimidine deaminase/5-amino-6-(5-phosphoribosylamino)uracil reductase RibD [Bacteroidetes bacterium]|nr:bifunctional diaminohydroxyphosphoribosylaminopyrimidine deaminase/5-amino-6-(5-phosphoribosylamino)uracil reductase RibD [Bacteroidota bacterium]
MTASEKYVQRCIELARLGSGKVSPNPMVGCVIVHNDTIIGEGWHQKYGGPHAEVNAIESIANKDLLKESTIYVSLEPCSIFGNTPPCADLIIRHRIPRVVIATLDDHPGVSGNGVKRLQEHGIQVTTGVCEESSRNLNKYFITHQTANRPYVHLKWAESKDGYFAPAQGRMWLSNSYTKRLTHKWRRDIDAILVGKRTAAEDDPQLTDRYWSEDHPLRIVIDPHLELSTSLKLFSDGFPTLVLNNSESHKKDSVEYVRMPAYPYEPKDILSILHARRIMSVLIEGGAQTLKAFIKASAYDEVAVFRTDTDLCEGIMAPELNGVQQTEEVALADNLLVTYHGQ